MPSSLPGDSLGHIFKLYVDMDGVLTAFDKACTELIGKTLDDTPVEERPAAYKKIEDAGPDFWHLMTWLDEGRKFWEAIKKFHPVILSSPGRFSYAKPGKTLWIRDHIPGTAAFFTEDKHQYAERDAILVDDTPAKIESWVSAGGIGILFKDAHQAEMDILRLLAPPDGC